MVKKEIDNTETTIVGSKIKELRLLNGLTQEQLSERIGIDNKKLSRIETGKSMPSLKVARELTQLFNYNLYDLVGNSVKEDIEIPDNYFVQSLNILKSAKNKQERKCYLNALKHTQQCLNIQNK